MRPWALSAIALLAGCPRTAEPATPSLPLPPSTSDTSQDPLRLPPELHLRKVRQLSFGGRALSPVFSRDGKRLAYLSVPAASRDPDAGLPAAVPHVVDPQTGAELPNIQAAGAPLQGGTLTDLWLSPSEDPCADLSTARCAPTGACRIDATRELGNGPGEHMLVEPSGVRPVCESPHWPLSRTGPCATTAAGDWACLLIAASGTQLWLWPAGATTAHPLDTGPGDDADPAFSASGKLLTWSSTRGEAAGTPGGRVPSGIEVLPAIQFAQVTPPPALHSISPPGQSNQHPSPFPDGAHVVFASNADDASGRDLDLFRITAEGQTLERLTFAPGADFSPALSPNGHYLAWISERNAASPGEQDLMIAEWVE